MIIRRRNSGMDKDGQGFCSGRYLILFVDMKEDYPNRLFAAVRFCALRQFGQFSGGNLRLGSQKFWVGGSYGSTGLPRDLEEVEEENRRFLIRVPAWLTNVFWRPEHQGWNGPGSEAGMMEEWARSIDTWKPEDWEEFRMRGWYYG